jgi:GDP-6-deoxy-D-talose 4-dehydrogenase
LASRSDQILLTGIGGFTGRHLARKLRRDGYEVVGVGRHPIEDRDIFLDLLDLDATTRVVSQVLPRAIVHLAGVSLPTHGNIGEIYSANIIATANLFAALEGCKARPSLLVLASSATVYASDKVGSPIREDHALGPTSHYAISKQAAEGIGGIYSDLLPVVTTRPFNYTGPGQSTGFFVSKIVRHFAERRSEIHLGNLDLYRDISDVGRVVEAYSRILSASIAPTTVNICSGKVVYLADIITVMQEISGYKINVVSDKALMRPSEAHVICGSPVLLETLVGRLPNPDISETLREMYDHAVRLWSVK